MIFHKETFGYEKKLREAWNDSPAILAPVSHANSSFMPSIYWPTGEWHGNWLDMWPTICYGSVRHIWGFHSHGGTPIAGWFISSKIPSRNGWWLGAPHDFGKPPISSIIMKYPRKLPSEATSTHIPRAFEAFETSSHAPGTGTNCTYCESPQVCWPNPRSSSQWTVESWKRWCLHPMIYRLQPSQIFPNWWCRMNRPAILILHTS